MSALRHISRTQIIPTRCLYVSYKRCLNYSDFMKRNSENDVTQGNVQSKISGQKINPTQPKRDVTTGPTEHPATQEANLSQPKRGLTTGPAESSVAQQEVQSNKALGQPKRDLSTGPGKTDPPKEQGSIDANNPVSDLVHASTIGRKGGNRRGGGGHGIGKCGGKTIMPSDDMLIDVPIDINLKMNVRLEEYEISAGKAQC